MSIEMFSERARALQKIEERMGEVAALLSEMADALTNYPDGIKITGSDQSLTPFAKLRMDAHAIRADEWPSLAEIQSLLGEWHTEMHKARTVWQNLSPAAREVIVEPGAELHDPTRPVV